MKKLLLFPLLCLSLCAAPISTNVTFYFHWPGPSDFAGMTTNDYMTNIMFYIYSTTNTANPVTTWPLYSTWQGTMFLVQGPIGSQWTNTIPVDFTGARFFSMRAYSPRAAGGGYSPFSAVDFILAPLVTGTIDSLK